MTREEPIDCGRDGVLRRRLRVAAVEDGNVWLTGPRDSECRGCAARSGCGAGAIAEMVGREQGLRLPQTVPLAVGDVVVVTMESGAFLGSVLRAYLFPAGALVVVALIALAAGLSDAATAVLCIPALALALIPLARADAGSSPAPTLRIESRDTSDR